MTQMPSATLSPYFRSKDNGNYVEVFGNFHDIRGAFHRRDRTPIVSAWLEVSYRGESEPTRVGSIDEIYLNNFGSESPFFGEHIPVKNGIEQVRVGFKDREGRLYTSDPLDLTTEPADPIDLPWTWDWYDSPMDLAHAKLEQAGQKFKAFLGL